MVPVAEPQGAGRVRYRFPPLERRGVIAGWRGGQIASVAVGLVCAVLALRSRPTVAGVVVAVATVAASVALAFWPVQGRTGDQWLPLVARRWIARLSGGRVALGPGPGSGHALDAGPDPQHRPRPVAPGTRSRAGRAAGRHTPFRGLSIVGVTAGPDHGPTPMGVILDRPARTATAVLAVRGHSFALLGHGEQDSAIAAWARVLSSLSREGSAVHRVQWLESCLPDDGGSARRHCADHAVLGPESAAGRSYQSSWTSRRRLPGVTGSCWPLPSTPPTRPARSAGREAGWSAPARCWARSWCRCSGPSRPPTLSWTVCSDHRPWPG